MTICRSPGGSARPVSLVLRLLIGLTIGLSPLLPNSAYAQNDAFPDEDPPEDAIILTEEEAQPFLQEMGVQIPNEREEAEALRRRLAEDEQLVQSFLKQYPDLATRFTFEANDSSTKPTGDGNFVFTLKNKAGEEQEIVTMGREFLLSSLASSIREFPKRENQILQYEILYRVANVRNPRGFVSRRFPSPRRMQRFSARFINRRNSNLAKRLYRIIDQIKVPLQFGPPECDAEAGYEEGRDMSGSSCGFEAGGVMSNYNFPLKPFLTCMRNQARRGTCVSFAIAAAAETFVAKRYKQWASLSEQDLYYRGAGLWYPRQFGDGLWPWGVMERMRTDAYPLAYEEQWDYNPSRFRLSVPAGAPTTYQNSCDDYDGTESLYCSDTAHQGARICFPLFNSWFCFFVPAPASAVSPYKVTGITELWDAADADLSFVKAVIMLAFGKKPIVFTIPVHTSWDQPDANGFIRGAGLPVCPSNEAGQCSPQAGVCECNRGGHAVTAVGFIDNSKLPEGAPAGAGGGYFIVKNSWGSCFADGGYIYVPYDWMKNLASSAIAITSMSKS